MLARSGDDRRLRRNPGAFHKQVHAVEQRGVVRAESHFYALRPKPSRVELLVAVDREHRHAVPNERPRGRLPGAGEPDDESVCGKVEIGHDHGRCVSPLSSTSTGTFPRWRPCSRSPSCRPPTIVVCGGDTVSGRSERVHRPAPRARRPARTSTETASATSSIAEPEIDPGRPTLVAPSGSTRRRSSSAGHCQVEPAGRRRHARLPRGPRSDMEIVTLVTSPERLRLDLRRRRGHVVVAGHTHSQIERTVDGMR